jgi:hypothetical protein
VSLTLPDDTLQALNRLHPDTGWAIVKLLERSNDAIVLGPSARDVELTKIGSRRFLIVVNRAVFKSVPGVNLVPFTDTQAFLSLEPGRGMSDLELAVIDRLSDPELSAREREALDGLRGQLAMWRRDHGLRFHSRSIIVVEQINGASRSHAPRARRGTE